MQVKQQIKNDCVGEGQQKLTGPYWTGVVHWVSWELQLWEAGSWARGEFTQIKGERPPLEAATKQGLAL
jgi:hypothetical protein